MSRAISDATWKHMHELDVLIPLVPADRRPRIESAKLIALYLADKCYDREGYAAEAIQQICDATSLKKSTVRNTLRALDDVCWWKPVKRGNKKHATRRKPVFHLGEHAQVRPVDADTSNMHRSDLSEFDPDGGPALSYATQLLNLKLETYARLELGAMK